MFPPFSAHHVKEAKESLLLSAKGRTMNRNTAIHLTWHIIPVPLCLILPGPQLATLQIQHLLSFSTTDFKAIVIWPIYLIIFKTSNMILIYQECPFSDISLSRSLSGLSRNIWMDDIVDDDNTECKCEFLEVPVLMMFV